MNNEPIIMPATENDFQDIYEIINESASAYEGVIPSDLWHEPYMTEKELSQEIDDGVRFYCYLERSAIMGVMGIQDKKDVNLIRHAYVRTNRRNRGVGGALLRHLIDNSDKPILIGTWKAAEWAIRFYEKYGFVPVSEDQKTLLLRKYWNVPQRQIETSVVLGDRPFVGR